MRLFLKSCGTFVEFLMWRGTINLVDIVTDLVYKKEWRRKVINRGYVNLDRHGVATTGW